MLRRISAGWNFQRALYVLLGVLFMTQSLWHKDWMGAVVGSYFAAMGLLALGCASGICVPSKETKIETSEIEYEEIKQK